MAEQQQDFTCTICNKIFNREDNLKRHIQTVHEKDSGKFICQICQKKLSRRDYLVVSRAPLHNF